MGVGIVFIVGAGPGPGDLITVRGLRALEKADVVIADELLPRSFFDDLDLRMTGVLVIRRDDRDPALSQHEVNDLLVQHALAGRTVVRLKGGDPGVFGRGWEEAERLSQQGIPWEIIPGLTAGTALPALAGLSLTHRGEARSVALATGRLREGELNVDLPRADSLVLYMSVSALEALVRRLVADGWPEQTPVAVIEHGGLEWERHLRGALSEIAGIAQQARLQSPALIVVGEAARERVQRPTILFTGLDASNFRTLGTLLHWPALEIAEAPDAVENVREAINAARSAAALTVIFTSKMSARVFFSAARTCRSDLGLPTDTRVIAAGPGTADLLRRHGVADVIIPDLPGSEGIIRLLGEAERGHCVLIQGEQASEALERELTGRFDSITRLSLHRAVTHPQLGEMPLPEHDAIYLTSPSGVRAYHERFGMAAFEREVLCIGEPTRAALRTLGIDAKVVHPGVSDESSETQPTE